MTKETRERLSGREFGVFHLRKYKALGPCFCGILVMLFAASGCTVNLGGRERPLLRHGPIEGEVELIAEMDRSEYSGGADRESETRVFQERLNLRTKGDVYHPYLFIYAAGLGLGLDQQSVDSTDGSEKVNDSIDEYSFSGTFLKEKPYPFSFALSKYEDLVSRSFYGPLNNKLESESYVLRFQDKEFPMSFHYHKSENEQNPASSLSLSTDFSLRKEETFNYKFRHDFSKTSQFRFSFEHREGSQENDFSSTLTKGDIYSLSHGLRFGANEEISFLSTYYLSDFSLPLDSQTFRWNEGLIYEHTDDFQTNYTFESSESKREELNEKSVRLSAGFNHELYDSLRTSGNVYGHNTERQGLSEEDQIGGNLSVNYNKSNRWGNIFADYQLRSHTLDRTGSGGTGIVDDEQHVVPSGSTRPQVTLREINVDETSIIVENGAGDVFTKNLDYTISTIGGETRLTLNTLSGGAPPNFSSGNTFFVDYTYFVESERTEDTINQSFAIGQNFDNGLSVYFEHQRQDEDLTSTDDTAQADIYRDNMLVVDYTKGGLFLGGHYSMRDSTQQDSESITFDARYNWDVDSTKNVSVWGMKQIQNFGEPQVRDVDSMSLGSEFFWRLSEKYNFTANANYVEENDSLFGDTKGFEFNSELEYNNRQFSCLTGVEYSTLTRTSSETETLFLYMRIRRTF